MCLYLDPASILLNWYFVLHRHLNFYPFLLQLEFIVIGIECVKFEYLESESCFSGVSGISVSLKVCIDQFSLLPVAQGEMAAITQSLSII